MRLPREVAAALEGCGKPWSLDMGSRHIKIIVAGHFAGILPKDGKGNEGNRRATLNVAAQIKRVARTGQAARRG